MPRTAAEGISHFWLFRPRSPAVAQEHPPSVVSGPQRLAARLAERNRREEGGRKEALARIWLQLHSPAPWEMVRGVPCTALGTSHPADVIWSRRGSWYPAADASAEPSMHVPRVPAGCEHPWVPPGTHPGHPRRCQEQGAGSPRPLPSSCTSQHSPSSSQGSFLSSRFVFYQHPIPASKPRLETS